MKISFAYLRLIGGYSIGGGVGPGPGVPGGERPGVDGQHEGRCRRRQHKPDYRQNKPGINQKSILNGLLKGLKGIYN